MNIKPTTKNKGHSKTGQLNGITMQGVNEVLGFEPNFEDDPMKVNSSWCFEINGESFGVWDWKGSQFINQFSTFGNPAVLSKLFGKAYTQLKGF